MQSFGHRSPRALEQIMFDNMRRMELTSGESAFRRASSAQQRAFKSCQYWRSPSESTSWPRSLAIAALLLRFHLSSRRCSCAASFSRRLASTESGVDEVGAAAGIELEAAFDDDDVLAVASPIWFTSPDSPVLCRFVADVSRAAEDVEDNPPCSLLQPSLLELSSLCLLRRTSLIEGAGLVDATVTP